MDAARFPHTPTPGRLLLSLFPERHQGEAEKTGASHGWGHPSLSCDPGQLWGSRSLSFLYLKGQNIGTLPTLLLWGLEEAREVRWGLRRLAQRKGTGEASPEEKPAGWRPKVG